MVVSDWNAVGELIPHGVAADRAEAARLALHAGSDLDMISGCFREHLPAEAAGLDEAVARVLRCKLRLGLFDQPYADAPRAAAAALSPAHRALARQAARQALVLVRNQGGVLPLAATQPRILLCGMPRLLQQSQALFGTWALDADPADALNLLSAAKEVFADRAMVAEDPEDALQLARKSEVVLAVVGETGARSGEAHAVTHLGLPPGQLDWLTALAALGRPVVAIVLTGRPLVLTEVERLCAGVLVALHPGTEGALAIWEAVQGLCEPGGRLPFCLPRHGGQMPLHHAVRPTGRPYDESPAGGWFDSGYLDCPSSPLHTFGAGLGYTSWRYDAVTATLVAGRVEVRAQVTNTGDRAGSTVAQCYLRDPVAGRSRPLRELIGFQRLTLAPGAARTVVFSFGRDELGWLDESGVRQLEPGELRFGVGGDALAPLTASVTW
jgi:beta-glucosidase